MICGAGIAGIATAYHLAVDHGLTDIVLVEQGDPLALTSDKSTECYRNWWPGPGDAMVSLMNRSIDLIEGSRAPATTASSSTGAATSTPPPTRPRSRCSSRPPRRPPAWAPDRCASTGRRQTTVRARYIVPQRPPTGRRIVDLPSSIAPSSSYVPAPAQGFEGQPDGSDLILDPALIRAHFPYLTERTVAVLHARRCGWLSAQQLGMHLLEQARERGVRLLRGTVTSVDTTGGRVRGVQVATAGGTTTIATPHFVAAAGPLLPAVGRMLGVELPIFSERHIKIAFNDQRGAVPRDAPMLIWADDIELPWSDDEREALAEDDETRWLLGTFPTGVHCRPEGHGASTSLLILWNYHLEPVEPVFPVPIEAHYPELALRGMAVMLPSLARYFDRAPKPYIDGGYYTKTRENRPLIGPLPVAGRLDHRRAIGLWHHGQPCRWRATGRPYHRSHAAALRRGLWARALRRPGIPAAAGALARYRPALKSYEQK